MKYNQTEKRIRRLRQFIGRIPDGDPRESRATAAIVRLKARLPDRTAPDYHWMYAAE